MALAEARAAWQRTANRFIVQEDAKRAPKLAPFSSTTVCNNKPANGSGPTSEPSGQNAAIPGIFSWPFELNPSCPNLSPNTRWWLQLQPSYGHQKLSTDERPNTVQETSTVLAKDYESPFGDVKAVKKVDDDDSCLDPEHSLMGSGRHVPWWRTADAEELASFVAHGSNDLFENCDLPSPRSALAVEDFNFSRNEALGTTNQNFMNASSTPTKRSLEASSYKRIRMSVGSPKKAEMGKVEEEQGKAKILEALRHSQTRAREAEKVAKQASAEKEHVVKLVIRQATEIFACKQLIQLLQLENMYLSYYVSSAAQSMSQVFPLKRKKTRQRKYPVGKRVGDSSSWVDPVVLALGMGLICAGFLLGWSIGWILPTW